MTLKQLEYIIKVSQCGNITDAAQELFIAQPSLTHAIKELESEMGITIFTRTNKGVSLTNEGERFLSYARQVMDQANLLEDAYKSKESMSPKLSVSCQHYSFCVTAFADTIKEFDANKYNFTIRETQTHEIIEDVTNLKSELGVLYLSKSNKDVISKIIKSNDLVWTELYVAKPHVFFGFNHPLAKKERITIHDLKEYPYLTYEQGNYNSFYFSEEFISTIDTKKNILVRDRATLFNLAVALDGYTVSSGIIMKDVNDEKIIARPLDYNEEMHIGYIHKKNHVLSNYANAYLKNIVKYLK